MQYLLFYLFLHSNVFVISVFRREVGELLDQPRWDRILVRGEIFRTCPDRPWGPPSLLYNGYLVFPGGKERPGRDADPSPPSPFLCRGQETVELYLYSPYTPYGLYRASVPVQGCTLLLPYGEKRQLCGIIVVGYQMVLSEVGAVHIHSGGRQLCRNWSVFVYSRVRQSKFFFFSFTGLLISRQPDQEGNNLQRPISDFWKPLKKKIRRLSVQPGLRGSNDLLVGRNMVTFQLFFQSVRAKDLSAPLYIFGEEQSETQWLSGMYFPEMSCMKSEVGAQRRLGMFCCLYMQGRVK